jgi:hypothetical protein
MRSVVKGTLLGIFAFALLATTAIGSPSGVTRRQFSSHDRGSTVDERLGDLRFSAVSTGGRTIELVPGTYEVVDGPAVRTVFSFVADLACGGNGEFAYAEYDVQIGPSGRRGLPVHDERFFYRGAATNDGIRQKGRLEIHGHFAQGGTVAAGTVKVSHSRGYYADERLANCHTGKRAAGEPLRWRLVAHESR